MLFLFSVSDYLGILLPCSATGVPATHPRSCQEILSRDLCPAIDECHDVDSV